jgi:hypothetical protein
MPEPTKPLEDKEYLVTDSCFWETLTAEEKAKYNPHDLSRAPHFINLVDINTGTVVNLRSGSIIKITKAK